MAQKIIEGSPPNQLIFTFPDSWKLCKFDDTPFYRNRVEKLDGIKSVDIIAKGSDALQFIEIKDFRQHRIENKERQTNGELLIEVAQKFVSTIASLIGASRWNLIDFEPYYSQLSQSDKKVEVILFVERDERENTLRRNKLLLADLQQKLKKLLLAYNVKCKVYDREHLPMEWRVR